MTRRPNPHLLTAALAIGVLVALVLLWPQRLGGSTSYVSTHGTSMAPTMHEGDLALVRRAPRYRVGDVVAYRSSLLGTVVLHRIVDIDGGRYSFKGDSNGWRDADHPTRSNIIGRLWFRVPRAGAVASRWKLTIVLGAAGLLVFGRSSGLASRRWRRRDGTRVTASSFPKLSARHLSTAVIACSCASAICLGFGTYGLTRSSEMAAHRSVPYGHEAVFRYSAPGDSVSPDGLATGEPVFLRLTRVIDIEATYELSAGAATDTEGTIGLRAEVADASGWRRSFVITPPAAFGGTRAATHGRLDLRVLEDAIIGFRAATGTAASTYAVRVVADVDLTATIAGHPISARLNPELEFKLDALRLSPPATDPHRRPFIQSTPDTVDVVVTRPNRREIFGVGIDTRAIPAPAFLLGALAAFAAALCGHALRKRLHDPDTRIALKLGPRLVPILTSVCPDGRRICDLATIDDLARLADKHGGLILHEVTEIGHEYSVQVAHTVYRFRVAHLSA